MARLRKLFLAINGNGYNVLTLLLLSASFAVLLFFINTYFSFRQERLALLEEYSRQVNFPMASFGSEEELENKLTLEMIQVFKQSKYVEETHFFGYSSFELTTGGITDSEGFSNAWISFVEPAELEYNTANNDFEGQRPQAEDECMINASFAQAQGLALGDELVAKEEQDTPLKIVGIYDDLHSDYSNNEALSLHMFVPISGAAYLYGEEPEQVEWDVSFTLYRSQDLENFKKELKAKQFPLSNYQLESNRPIGEMIGQPLSKSEQLVLTLLLLFLVVSLLLVFLTSQLFWARRSNRIKYFYSIGLSRQTLLRQQLIAAGLMLGAAAILGYACNRLCGQELAQRLLQLQSTTAEQSVTQISNTIIVTYDFSEELAATVISWHNSWLLLPLSLVYLLIGNFRSVWYISRLSLVDFFIRGGSRL